jgi:hypothetical protein
MEKQLKLYHLNPNDWGSEYYTVAPDKDTALNNIKNYLKRQSLSNKDGYKDHYIREFQDWEKATPTNLLGKYTLDVYKDGEVHESELA